MTKILLILSYSLFYSIRDLRHRKKFTIIFIINLAIGLFSFLLVDSIKTSFNLYIENNSKEIATADIVIRSRRMMSEKENQVITSLYSPEQFARVSRFFSMASSPTSKSLRLIQVNAISDHFPLYGHIKLNDMYGNEIGWKEALKVLRAFPAAVITKEVKTLYQVKPGDHLRVGNRDYEVKYVLEKDVGDRLQISALAYKIYISEKQVETDILKEKGSTARFQHYIKILGADDEKLMNEVNTLRGLLTEVKNTGNNDSKDKNIDLNIHTHNQNSSNIQRIITLVHRYFELITLVTLFLCGVGIFYLFRNFIFSKVKEIAILESLGMKKYRIIFTLILELILLSSAGLITAVILFWGVRPLIPLAFGNILPQGISFGIQFSSLITTLIIAILGSLLFTFPIIWAAKKIQIITLIRQNLEPKKLLRMTLWSFIPNIIFFYALSVWIGESFILGSSFSGMFLGSIIIVFLIGAGFWKLFAIFKNSNFFTLSFITRNLYQNRSKGFFYFFAISLSVALISLTPQLEYSINQEIESPKGMSLPSLFIFEVKKGDLSRLEEMTEKVEGDLLFPSPMISAEIKTVNGEPFRRLINDNDSQEREGDSRRNQVNLTYRNFLSKAETIVDGEPLSSIYNGKSAEVSLEERFAERNGLDIGDEIGFSLINVPFVFMGKVVNLRKVRWNSFQPNFFITVQDQVLNQVPQKFVTSVNQITFENKIKLISQINAAFPHISVLDVQEIIQEILKLISQFSLLLKMMAGFCFILGLMILFTIINQEIKNQEREINLMKTIGGKFSTLYVLVLGEYTLVGLLAMLSGLVPGIVLNFFFSVYFFDGAFTFSPTILIEIIAMVLPGIIFVNYLGARKILHDKPIILLKENG